MLKYICEKYITEDDLNAKYIDWGSVLTTVQRRELSKIDYNNHSSDKPTYFSTDFNKMPYLLDLFITRNMSPKFIEIEENYTLNSNLSMVTLTLIERIIKKNDATYTS